MTYPQSLSSSDSSVADREGTVEESGRRLGGFISVNQKNEITVSDDLFLRRSHSVGRAVAPDQCMSSTMLNGSPILTLSDYNYITPY